MNLNCKTRGKRMTRAVRPFCLFCAVWILLAGFCGCGRFGGHAYTADAEPLDSVRKTKCVSSDDVDSNPEKGSRKRNFNAKTLILTIDGAPVYWPEFRFWLNFIKKYYKKHHHLKVVTDWDARQNGMRLGDFYRTTAVGYACKDRAIAAKAGELGIALSENDLAQIEKERAAKIRIYGSRSQYLRIVRRMYVSEEVFDYLTRIDILSRHLFAYYYGPRGEKCSDKAVWQYVAQKGLMCSKYIFLSNFDAHGNALKAPALAENDKRLRYMLNRLDARNDSRDDFDVLINTYGQDPQILRYPYGRLLASGRMDPEFDRAYSTLNVYEHSGIVRSARGSYIILRMPIFPDMTADAAGNSLRYRTAFDFLFRKQIEAWCAQKTIGYHDAYKRIEVEKLWKR